MKSMTSCTALLKVIVFFIYSLPHFHSRCFGRVNYLIRTFSFFFFFDKFRKEMVLHPKQFLFDFRFYTVLLFVSQLILNLLKSAFYRISYLHRKKIHKTHFLFIGSLGRECIIPDVSRTYHFGASGLNVDPNFQEIYFKTRSLNMKTGNHFDTAKVTKDGYEDEMNRVIS